MVYSCVDGEIFDEFSIDMNAKIAWLILWVYTNLEYLNFWDGVGHGSDGMKSGLQWLLLSAIAGKSWNEGHLTRIMGDAIR